MSKQNKLNEVVSFRLSEEEFEPYKAMIAEQGTTKAKLFRQIVLSKEAVIAVEDENKDDLKRAIFIANKSSNNINQIAKRLHQHYRTGVVSERLYEETLNQLITLEELFSSVIEKC